MHVRLHAPLSTSVIPCASVDPGAGPALAVVVAATFRFTGASLVLQARPMPIDQDLAGSMSPEHWRVSDEVPGKASPEVLLVGHAFSPVPVEVIPVRLRLGTVDKRCVAVAGAPSQRVPLSSVYLRAGPGGAPVRVGPVPPRPPPPGASVDLASFNAAPDDQRLAEIVPGAALLVEGTAAGRGRMEVSLPALRPTAFLAPRGAPPTAWAPVQLTCDTLWIDADGESLVMVWRGRCPPVSGHVELQIGAAVRSLLASELAGHGPVEGAPGAPSLGDPFEATMEMRAVTGDAPSPFSRGEASPPGATPPLAGGSGAVVSPGLATEEDFDIFDEDTVGIGHTTMESDAVTFAELAKLEPPVRVEEAKAVSEREGAKTLAMEDLGLEDLARQDSAPEDRDDELPAKPTPRVGEATLEVTAIDPSLLEPPD